MITSKDKRELIWDVLLLKAANARCLPLLNSRPSKDPQFLTGAYAFAWSANGSGHFNIESLRAGKSGGTIYLVQTGAIIRRYFAILEITGRKATTPKHKFILHFGLTIAIAPQAALRHRTALEAYGGSGVAPTPSGCPGALQSLSA